MKRGRVLLRGTHGSGDCDGQKGSNRGQCKLGEIKGQDYRVFGEKVTLHTYLKHLARTNKRWVKELHAK